MNLIGKICTDKQCTSKLIGRIGGNVPGFFLNRQNEICDYRYYLTIQCPFSKDDYISIFVPKSFEKLIDNNIYPKCAVKVFSHPLSEESSNSEYTMDWIHRTAIEGYEESENCQFITVSKEPYLIHDEDFYIEKLHRDDYRFLLQIDEDYYPKNLLDGNYIFAYGTLYIYQNVLTKEIIAGFWQF